MALGTLVLLATQVGIPLARSYFQGKDIKKAQRKAREENERRQAMSNFINALSPRARHQPLIVDPELRESGISEALGAAQTGLTAFNLYQGLKGQEVARMIDEQTLADAKEAAQTRAGKQAAQAFRDPRQAPELLNLDPTIRRQITEQSRPALPKSLASTIGRAGRASFTQTAEDLARAAEDRDSKRRLQSFKMREAEMGILGADMAIQVARKKLLEVPTAVGRKLTDVRAIGTGLGAGNPGLTKEDLFELPSIMAMNAGQRFTNDEKTSLWSSYSQEGQRLSGELNKTHQAQANAFEDRLARDLTVKEKAEFTRALDQIVSGLEVGAGFGDVQLLKMLARLQDPNSVVRQAEFETMKEALPFFDQVGIRLRAYVTGEQLNDKGRLHVLNLAVSAYDGRKPIIDSILDDAMAGVVATPGLENMGDILELRAERFKLPALEDWTRTVDGKEVSVAQRIGAQRLRLKTSWANTLAENTPIAPVVPVVTGKYGQAYDLDRAAQALKLRRR